MKNVFLLFLLILISHAGFSQWRTPVTAYGEFKLGAGLATKDNYDVGPIAEFDFCLLRHYVRYGIALGYQEYSLFSQNTSPYAVYNPNYSGVTLRNRSDYAFVAPQLAIPIPYNQHVEETIFEVHINGGIGYLISGTETLHKWDNSNTNHLYTRTNFDSTINTSSNINKMVYRYGVGLTQQIHMNRAYFTFSEDVTFIGGNLSTTVNPDNPSRTAYTPDRLSPIYYSVSIGLRYYHKAHMHKN